jgi:hypothetical protein
LPEAVIQVHPEVHMAVDNIAVLTLLQKMHTHALKWAATSIYVITTIIIIIPSPSSSSCQSINASSPAHNTVNPRCPVE